MLAITKGTTLADSSGLSAVLLILSRYLRTGTLHFSDSTNIKFEGIVSGDDQKQQEIVGYRLFSFASFSNF